MSKKQVAEILYPDSHVVESFRHRANTLDAISEFIDNSNDAGASTFRIRFAADFIKVNDDGLGCQSLDLIFGLGHSRSKHDRNVIGRFGIGAKDAMLHFGSVVQVETVYEGRYHTRTLDWDEIEACGWPTKYVGKGKPTPLALGTTITITKLATGRSRISPEILIKRLSHRYRPFLRKGKTITIDWYGQEYTASEDANAIGAWNNERELIGTAAGKKFTIRYTDLKEYDQHLSGIHIAFGDRFIEHIKKLNGKNLPHLLYAEVLLKNTWKNCLSANKTEITLYRDELEASVFELLKDWIGELETFSEEARVEKLNALLHKATAELLQFQKGTGQFKKGKQILVHEHGDGDDTEPGPPRKLEYEAEKDEASNDGDKKPKKKPPTGIFYNKNDTLGHTTYMVTFTETKITVELNGSIPAIDVAYKVPYKLSAIWPIISTAFAGWCRQNLVHLEEYVPGLLSHLVAKGYNVDAEHPEDVEDTVMTWMMRQQPLSVQEIEKQADTA